MINQASQADFQENLSELLTHRIKCAQEQAELGLDSQKIIHEVVYDFQQALHTITASLYGIKVNLALPEIEPTPPVVPYNFVNLLSALEQYEGFSDRPLQIIERHLIEKGISVCPWLKPNKYRLYINWIDLNIYAPSYLKVFFEHTEGARLSPIARLKSIGLFLNIVPAPSNSLEGHPYLHICEQAILSIETKRISEQIVSKLENL